MPSYAQHLRRRLEEIVELTDRLHEVSEIEHDPHKVERMSRKTGMAIMMILPDSTWCQLDDEGRRRQREVLDRWDRWLPQMQLLFLGDARDTRAQLDEAAEKVSRWLHRSGRDFSVPKDIEAAGQVFRKHVEPLFKLLAPFEVEGPVVMVPDTNVLLRNQELPTWTDAVGTKKFTVLLVPGVLAEIDEQKINHRNEPVREKARSFSNRLKGWRNQGSLARGVRVQGEVFVRVVAREPDFDNTLSWLDPGVTDDRIIASVLEFQRNNPTMDVRLLSGDSIMLTKADEAELVTGDVPNKA